MGEKISNSDGGISRRNVLKSSAGATVLVSAAGLGIVRAGENNDWPVEVIKATRDNPASSADVKERRATARQKVESRIAAAVTKTEPEIVGDSENVVGHAVTFDDNGAMHHYTAGANSESAKSHAHQKLDEVARRFRNKDFRHSSAEQSAAGLGEASSSGTVYRTNQDFDSDWRFYDTGNYDEFSDPHGVVTVNYDIAYLENDELTRDAYGIDAVCAAQPGYDYYGSSWRGDRGEILHDYEATFTETDNPDLDNFGPSSDHQEGSDVTVNAGVNSGGVSAGFSWSYDPGIGIEVKSSYADNYAKWNTIFYPNDYCGQKYLGQVEPGSSVLIREPSSGSGSQSLLKLKHEHQFIDNTCHYTIPPTESVVNSFYPATIDY